MCRAVGTSNLHPEQLVLEGDDVAGTMLDLGDFKNSGTKIVFTTVSIILDGVNDNVSRLLSHLRAFHRKMTLEYSQCK